MPRVLTKLRIDEISAVSGGAGENVKIVLMKRDGADERDGFYRRLFAGVGKSSGHAVRKFNRYGGHLRHRHDGNLDHQTALHWVLHTAQGAAVRNRLNIPAEEVADLLVEAAAMHPTEKVSNHINKEDENMSEINVVSFAKRVVADGESAISEAQATELIKKYSDAHRLPGEKSSVAFSRIFGGDDDVGLNFRKMVQIAKGHPHPHCAA